MEEVRRDRIRIAVYAAAYELRSVSMVSDAEYDTLAIRVGKDLANPTDRPDLDRWFQANYTDYSGGWVHRHPELRRILQIVDYGIDGWRSDTLPAPPA